LLHPETDSILEIDRAGSWKTWSDAESPDQSPARLTNATPDAYVLLHQFPFARNPVEMADKQQAQQQFWSIDGLPASL
jgi:hypothetical protein